jgi:anti-anti-sigma regulatory factor
MNLKTTEDGRVTILTLDGDLVIGEPESTFKRTITRLIEEGKVHLLVDLTSAQKEGGQTKLLNAGPQIRKLLEMTKLDSVFELHEDRETAVSSF